MLSTNSTLERLDVSGNNLGSDYFSRCVGPALRINKSLKALKFSSCGSSDVSAICEAMTEDNVTIEELDASNNHIGAVFGEGLTNILQVYEPGINVIEKRNPPYDQQVITYVRLPHSFSYLRTLISYGQQTPVT